MNVDMMRRIDRWGGIPLCFILTQIHRLLPARTKTKPHNILFIELSEMGSTILADPAMQKAKHAFGANIHFVIFKRNAGSLAFLQTVPLENIFTIREDNLITLALDTFNFLRWTRKNKIDTVIDLELFSRFTTLLSGMAGAIHRVGFYRFHNEGLYRGELLTHRVAYNPHIHIAKNFIALINALLSPAYEIPYSKTLIGDEEIILQKAMITDAAKEAMRTQIRSVVPSYTNQRIVLINPNASEMLPQRRWPHENFATLATSILERWQDVIILVTGASGESAGAQHLIQLVNHPNIINFAGLCRLHELTALYSIADLMITNDSGPGHFSSVTDLQTIVLFGPETPALYGSLGKSEPVFAGLACSPCVSATNHRKTACKEPVCMTAITPENVLQRISHYL